VRGEHPELAAGRGGAPLADVSRRHVASPHLDAFDGDAAELERLLVQEPDPVRPRAIAEVVEPEVVVAADRRDRRHVRRTEPSEHVLEIAGVRELDEVAQHDDQVDLLLPEPRERRVEPAVEVLRLVRVDPPGAGGLQLAVEVAEDAEAGQGLGSP
jgi:hypothetical protein